jgi:hypothetical protein
MTLADRIAAIEARADAARNDCLCGLPQCPNCDAQDAFVSAARDDVPALCSALKVACEAGDATVKGWDKMCHGANPAIKYLSSSQCAEARDFFAGLNAIRAALASIERILGGGK